MSKSREGKEDEFYKSQIRSQKKEIKRLNQKVKQLERLLNYDQNKSPKSERKTKEIDLDQCLSCGKGYLKTSDYGVRKITTCSLCSFRKVSK